MNHLETSYTTQDGLKLYLQAWLPEEPKASLLLVHGLGEHSGRYDHLVKTLNQLGVAVFTFDGRGHGKSAEGKPDAFFASYEDYLKDINSLFEKVKSYVPNVPSFIYGHSMGGGLVAAFVLKYKPEASGVILSSAAIKEAEGTSPLLIASAKWISKIFPRLKVLALDANSISRIPEEVSKYLDDPLVYTKSIPARTGYELLRMTRFIQDSADEFSLPVLIIHGTDDKLTNPEGSKLLHAKAKSSDKVLQLFEGGYHELLNDLDSKKALDLIHDWVKTRIE
ncbi:alpha/beta hydrolase [Algoriphagus sediminis]|uniref:Lysophospholipase n=1 Tax=Algoriphagus sediminis TaxID=3057113 RepID=A0ABT7Y9S0_9BACT|nr:alpha/beta hydrolase [Algoriphagus sediminis]MDN3203272.1 lysophospholipase [Algoriphagus sediminis]